jgi:hypothetical protein
MTLVALPLLSLALSYSSQFVQVGVSWLLTLRCMGNPKGKSNAPSGLDARALCLEFMARIAIIRH